jgi:hypothetical protein
VSECTFGAFQLAGVLLALGTGIVLGWLLRAVRNGGHHE